MSYAVHDFAGSLPESCVVGTLNQFFAGKIILRSHALRLGFLLLASYGLLYAAYKFYDPVVAGHDDFYNYYKMHQAPLDFTATTAPFIYRQFSAIITHAIFASGIYYPKMSLSKILRLSSEPTLRRCSPTTSALLSLQT